MSRFINQGNPPTFLTPPQLRGMLLEEAVLYLLRMSGYRVIDKNRLDATVIVGKAGLEVKGRGGKHQIDAIADLVLAVPFSYPQRLLIEAKCFVPATKVGIEVVRNAVGVLKDVGEFWITLSPNLPAKQRFHYQYAIFSASSYTAEAQRYAFAQDIYLIQLAKSQYVKPIIHAIHELVRPVTFPTLLPSKTQGYFHELRMAVRERLGDLSDNPQMATQALLVREREVKFLDNFFKACVGVNRALLAVIDGRFPIFLVPDPQTPIKELNGDYFVRITEEAGNWYLKAISESNPNSKFNFSFDLPEELFKLYAEEGILSASDVLEIKERYLSQMQALTMIDNRPRLINFNLEQSWLEEIREHLNNRSNEY